MSTGQLYKGRQWWSFEGWSYFTNWLSSLSTNRHSQVNVRRRRYIYSIIQDILIFRASGHFFSKKISKFCKEKFLAVCNRRGRETRGVPNESQTSLSGEYKKSELFESDQGGLGDLEYPGVENGLHKISSDFDQNFRVCRAPKMLQEYVFIFFGCKKKNFFWGFEGKIFFSKIDRLF